MRVGAIRGGYQRRTLSSASPNPPDPPEPPVVTWIASGAISAHRVVKMLDATRVGYCDANAPSDRALILGVTLQAANDGEPIDVRRFDLIADPSWSWTPGLPLYCGPLGALTQIHDPAWAWVEIIGVAIDAVTISIRVQSAVSQI